MNEIRQLIVNTATKMMKDYSTKEVIQASEHGVFAQPIWDKITESGLTSIGIAEEKDGSGGSYADAMSVIQVMGKYAAPIPFTETLMANWLLSACDRAFSPDRLLTIALPEIGRPTEYQFGKQNNGWRLTGQAKSVPYGQQAEGIVVVGQGEQELVLTLLTKGSYEIQPGKNLAGEPYDTIQFAVDLSAADVVMLPQKWNQRIHQLSALTRVALMTGGLERILEQTVAYSSERSQFGRPIGKFQAVQQQVAIMAGEVTAVNAAFQAAIEAFDAGGGDKEVAMAKVRAGEAVTVAAPIAHQVHGAIGFTQEHSLQLNTRRLWTWRDEYGNESEWANYLGKFILGNDAESLWKFIIH
jgi:acyl-CoA dehydrogenase